MPRGKYVNHKGRNRHFTSPEELQRELDSDEESSSADDEEAAGTSSKAAKSNARAGKMPTSSEESSDDEEEVDRDAKKGVASLIEIENPNRAVKKATVKVEAISLDEPERELTRREREQVEKVKAQKRYEKLHAAGKTPQAKADLARLALIKEQRQQAAAKREAEKLALAEKNTTSKA